MSRVRRLTVDGRSLRFTTRLDEETERFEDELHARLAASLSLDGERRALIELPLQQRHLWLRHSTREHRLLQIRDAEGLPAMQVAVRVDRPRLFGWYGEGFTSRLGRAINEEEERFGLAALRDLCRDSGDLLTLRLQPYRTELGALRDFEARARRLGFHLTDPVEVTRTLVADLRPSADEHLAALSKKTRAKIKHRSRSSLSLRVLTETRHLPACRAAVAASMRRTGGDEPNYDFDAALALATAHPERARIIGLFVDGRPDDLLAYVSGFRHGTVAEYSSAGSLDDPQLRGFPFNYFLLWELMQWARESGASWLDLGGVTDGGSDDPRAGISSFKRHFTELDVEHGRELVTVLQPARRALFETARGLRRRISR